MGLAVFFLVSTSSVYAYTDKVAVETLEVWTAAREALKPYGIRNENKIKGEIESKWIYDRVVRSRSLGFFKKMISENVDRRYRVRIHLKPEPFATEISVRGLFQDRSTGTGPLARWRKVTPGSEDYAVERDFFFKMIQALETLRHPSSASPSSK